MTRTSSRQTRSVSACRRQRLVDRVGFLQRRRRTPECVTPRFRLQSFVRRLTTLARRCYTQVDAETFSSAFQVLPVHPLRSLKREASSALSLSSSAAKKSNAAKPDDPLPVNPKRSKLPSPPSALTGIGSSPIASVALVPAHLQTDRFAKRPRRRSTLFFSPTSSASSGQPPSSSEPISKVDPSLSVASDSSDGQDQTRQRAQQTFVQSSNGKILRRLGGAAVASLPEAPDAGER